jgi:uncharacterized protein YutE (UPF0331/DUF86 family)
MSEGQVLESAVLRNLQQVSEARGLKFYVDPPREIVPPFLGNYQPDAIAIGPEGGIIIDVKLRRSPASDSQLARISKQVSDQKGWEFRAIYLNPPLVEMPSIAKPTIHQLLATLKEIEALAKGGHSRAALVMGWAALESLARLASANSDARRSGGFSPIRPIQTLAEEGYLEHEAAERLREMAKLRNAVVHGDFSINVPTEQVENLLTQLRAILSDITTVTPE